MDSRSVALFIFVAGFSFSPALENGPRMGPFSTRDREVSQTLYLNNPLDFGVWGEIDLCENGSYVYAAEVNFQSPNNLDETAINAIRLYCETDDHIDTGYVSSSTGNKGDWYGMQICSGSNHVTGIRAQVLEYQGLFTDDVALQDFELDCGYGTEIVDALPGLPAWGKIKEYNSNIDTFAFNEGDWSIWQVCLDGLRVCGIQTRYEDGSLGDETAISDAVFYCCT